MSKSRSHVGAASELIACAWFLKRGWEVFRNVSPAGKADIVVTKGETILRLDITTANGNGERIYRNYEKERSAALHGVKVLYVLEDGTCLFASGNEAIFLDRIRPFGPNVEDGSHI